MRLDGSTRIRALLLSLSLASGCWHEVAAHCPGCVVLSDRVHAALPIPADARAVVLLVHGALGFGEEWRPLVDELHRHPHVVTAAFRWSGPFGRNPSLAAEALRAQLQQIVDDAPAQARILVIAHSAGGALTAYAAPRLRVPPGRRVEIASIAGADDMNLARYEPDERVNTPLGFAIGGSQPRLRVVAPGVDYVEYATADAPPVAAKPDLDGARRVYLGRHVGHNASIARAGLPLVRGL